MNLDLAFPENTPRFVRALANYGYAAIVASPAGREIARPGIPCRFDDDSGEEIESPDDPAYQLACRDYDRQIILALRASCAAQADPNVIALGGLNLAWPRRMSRLKTYGGNQTLHLLMRDRLDCLLLWAGEKPKQKKTKVSADAPAGIALTRSTPSNHAARAPQTA